MNYFNIYRKGGGRFSLLPNGVKDLRKGDIFIMEDPDDGQLCMDSDGNTVHLCTDDPARDPETLEYYAPCLPITKI